LIDVLLAQSQIDAARRELAAVDVALKGGTDPPRRAFAQAQWMRARVLELDNRTDLALPTYERAIEAALQAEGAQSRLANEIRLSHARSLIYIGQVEAGKRQLAAALGTMRALGGEDDLGASVVEANFVYILFDAVFESRRFISFDEAIASLERIRKRLDESPTRVPEAIRARVDFKLGSVYQAWGDVERAHALIASSAPVLRSRTEAPITQMIAAIFLGLSAMDRGEHEEADSHLREALELGKIVEKGPGIASRYSQLARNLSMQGHYDEADALLASVVGIGPVAGSAVAPMGYAESISLARAMVALDRGDPAAALAQLPPEQGTIDDYLFEDRRLLRGAALCGLGKPAEGLPLLEKYTDVVAREAYAYHPRLAYWRATTGLCALDAGDRRRAVELAASAREAFARQPGVSLYYKARLAQLDRRLRVGLPTTATQR
jgi:tetratricopeptide (TPR) repeat protein